jgi:Cu(I)-responsive transcriptional regulator
MNIGEAARASGISAKMIRHYEAIGLIAAGRGANHYRVYSQADVAELRFIRHARDLGFPLQDVKRLLDLWRNRARASAEVKRLALDHVAALEAKAKSLSAMAESLRHLADHCHGDARPECPILEELAGAFSSQVGSLGGSENATRQAFSSQVASLGDSENATKQAFSSQAVPLGGSENATKKQER